MLVGGRAVSTCSISSPNWRLHNQTRAELCLPGCDVQGHSWGSSSAPYGVRKHRAQQRAVLAAVLSHDAPHFLPPQG